jgi:hypothetical protein
MLYKWRCLPVLYKWCWKWRYYWYHMHLASLGILLKLCFIKINEVAFYISSVFLFYTLMRIICWLWVVLLYLFGDVVMCFYIWLMITRYLPIFWKINNYICFSKIFWLIKCFVTILWHFSYDEYDSIWIRKLTYIKHCIEGDDCLMIWLETWQRLKNEFL